MKIVVINLHQEQKFLVFEGKLKEIFFMSPYTVKIVEGTWKMQH